ncbi:MAG: dihydrofolate reductase family protein [Gemmatimonadota bacterium]
MPRAVRKSAAKKAAAKRTTAKTPTKQGARRVVYGVAMSLDGYIAGPKGEYDWIVMDPDIDFKAMFARFDTFLMGRNTFRLVEQGGPSHPGARTIVFSHTLQPAKYPKYTIVSENAGEFVRELKTQPGKDIWLFGGGELFRHLLDAGVVDEVSVAVIPVVIGGGVPFLPAPARRSKLRLTDHHVYPKSGTVRLTYDVL